MSYMTMNMSALPIWGFDRNDAEMRIARQAGWTRSDLVWERLMETGLTHAVDGKPERALRLLRLADWLARARFSRNDPRKATAPAARARLLYRLGKHSAAEALQKRALTAIKPLDTFISSLNIAPRARSSLFHLRMEARHRDTYHENFRRRLFKIADESRAHLITLTSPTSPPHRLLSRWRGEKPTVFDDTRKCLAACLLMPD